MIQAAPALLNAQVGATRHPLVAGGKPVARSVRDGIRITLHEDLVGIEHDWRAFEQHADCTVFQCFDWLAAWQRHIGSRRGVRPAIVVGRDDGGAMLFLLPLAIERAGFACCLTWLGSDLCDYNAPLLAADFPVAVGPGRFASLWREIGRRLQGNAGLQYDFVCFDKMPEQVGGQDNPFTQLAVAASANRAYLSHLTDDWESFYAAKRSSTTRRRDRTKRKRLSEHGEIRFVGMRSVEDIAATFDLLMAQKAGSLARMGVSNIFERRGYRKFFLDIATGTASHKLVHISRLDIGQGTAAANLGLVFRDRYYHVIASHDIGEISRFGPGMAHLHDLLRYAIERRCRVFDFTIGNERYKREWSDVEMTLYDHVAIARWRGIPAAVGSIAVFRLKCLIKRTPALWDAVCRFRSFLGSLRRENS